MNGTNLAGVLLSAAVQASNAPPMPDGPNFGALGALSGPIEFIIGVILAVATVMGVIMSAAGLVRWSTANKADNPIKAKEARESVITGLVIALIAGFGFTLLFQAIWNIGSQAV